MKFEEVMPALREGKKIRVASYPDCYFIAVYESLFGVIEERLTIRSFESNGTLHFPKEWFGGLPPHFVMCDDWEIIE